MGKELRESGKAGYPNGWIIKSYRHMNIPKSDFQETEKLFNEVHKNILQTSFLADPAEQKERPYFIPFMCSLNPSLLVCYIV